MTICFAKMPLRAARDPRLRAADHRVLIAICCHANANGLAYPSLACIAAETGIAQRHNVCRSIARLEEFGYLRHQRHKRGPRLWDRSSYEIIYDSPSAPTQIAESAAPNGTAVPAPVASHIVTKGSGTPRKTPPPRRVDFDDEISVKFEEFWDAYPPKYGNPKNPALLIFRAVVKAGADPDLIIRGAKNYAAYFRRSGKGQEYVAHAKTWLNQQRWEQHQSAPELPKSRVGMV